MPEYRHGAPWPRPRPCADVAARARLARRARAERGVSTAADAREELEEKVSESLFGVVPEEYCRDVPPPNQDDREGGRGSEGARHLLAATTVSRAQIASAGIR